MATTVDLSNKITNANASRLSDGARTVSIYGDWLFIGSKFTNYNSNGANTGAVFVYQKVSGTWTLNNTLSVSGTLYFGNSVSVYNERAVVGQAGTTTASRKIYIYKLNTSTDVWSLFKTIDNQTSQHNYSYMVQATDKYIMTSSWKTSGVSGKLYIYTKASNYEKGSTWILTITANSSPNRDNSFRMFAATDNYVVYSFGNQNNNSAGYLRIYSITEGSGTSPPTLTGGGNGYMSFDDNNDSGNDNTYFKGDNNTQIGYDALAISDDYMIALPKDTHLDDGNSNDNGQNKIYFFVKNSSDVWVEKEIARTAQNVPLYEHATSWKSVAIYGDYFVIGERKAGGDQHGRALIYKYDSSADTFSHEFTLAKNPQVANDALGVSVAIDSTTVYMAAPADNLEAGAVYYYQYYTPPPPCFLLGTQIKTLNGYKNIEDLKDGETIIDSNGVNKNIKGAYKIAVFRNVGLVEFQPNSIAPFVPFRTTTCISYHGIEFNGKIHPALDFCNGSTIRYYPQYMEYVYHLEFDDVSTKYLANGLVSESLDIGPLDIVECLNRKKSKKDMTQKLKRRIKLLKYNRINLIDNNKYVF